MYRTHIHVGLDFLTNRNIPVGWSLQSLHRNHTLSVPRDSRLVSPSFGRSGRYSLHPRVRWFVGRLVHTRSHIVPVPGHRHGPIPVVVHPTQRPSRPIHHVIFRPYPIPIRNHRREHPQLLLGTEPSVLKIRQDPWIESMTVTVPGKTSCQRLPELGHRINNKVVSVSLHQSVMTAIVSFHLFFLFKKSPNDATRSQFVEQNKVKTKN